jgi:hypothetical protein
MHRHRRHRDAASEPSLQLSHLFVRIALFIVALAVLSAGAPVFDPFSDLSALQLGAGPLTQGPDQTSGFSVLARTGRSWGTAKQRQTAAASAPIARLARRDTLGP